MFFLTHLNLFSPDLGQDATAILAVSRSTEVWSPELTSWETAVLQAIDLDSPVTQEILEMLGTAMARGVGGLGGHEFGIFREISSRCWDEVAAVGCSLPMFIYPNVFDW